MASFGRRFVALVVVSCASFVLCAQDGNKETAEAKVVVAVGPPTPLPPVQPDSTTENSVTVGGEVIAYRAVAGTLTVGATDPQDAILGLDGRMLPDTGEKTPDPAKPEGSGHIPHVLRSLF